MRIVLRENRLIIIILRECIIYFIKTIYSLSYIYVRGIRELEDIKIGDYLKITIEKIERQPNNGGKIG